MGNNFYCNLDLLRCVRQLGRLIVLQDMVLRVDTLGAIEKQKIKTSKKIQRSGIHPLGDTVIWALSLNVVLEQ